MIKLSLPPLTGTNTAHPAFRMLGKEPQMNTSVRPDEYSLWCDIRYATFNPISAAAIAHYWREHYNRLLELPETGSVKYANRLHTAQKEYEKWSSIAAGSRDYDGAKIVGYTPHG